MRDEATIPRGQPPRTAPSLALNTLAVLAVFLTLYVARGLILPLVLALLLALLLTPAVTRLRRWGVPRALGAGAIVLTLGGALALGTVLLAAPATAWLEKAPQLINRVQDQLSPLQRQVRDVSEAAKKVQDMADGGDRRARLVHIEGSALRNAFLKQAQAFVLGAFVLFFLLYFLLASADRLRQNLLRVLPDMGAQRRMFVMLRRMQRDISRYLLTISLINLVLGALVAGLTWACGLPNPILWGVVGGLLNYVPYLGPSVGIVILGLVAASTLSMPQALLVPAVFALLTSLEGQLITPTVLGRNLALNPVFIFLALIFWGWLWGIIGALLAVPIMVSFKIVCDNISSLRPVGVMLGR